MAVILDQIGAFADCQEGRSDLGTHEILSRIGIEVLELDLQQGLFDLEAKLDEFRRISVRIDVCEQIDRRPLWDRSDPEITIWIGLGL